MEPNSCNLIRTKKTGFTLEDPMCFVVNVVNIFNQVTKLRMILRVFVYYKKEEGESETKYAEAASKGNKISVGHYLTFIYLNDNQWVILDGKDYFLVPAGYAFFSQHEEQFLPLRDKYLIKETTRKWI